VALVLLSYLVLTLLRVLQGLGEKNKALDSSICLLAFHLRKYILLESITMTLKTMKIRFKQNILDSCLDNYGLKKCKISVNKKNTF
jgi:hypothetical protein